MKRIKSSKRCVIGPIIAGCYEAEAEDATARRKACEQAMTTRSSLGK